MRIFVDTAGLLPLLDGSDQDHDAVVGCVEELGRQGATLVTSSYTLVEAGALVKRRLGARAFARLGQVAMRALDIVWVDENLHGRAWAAAASHGSKGPSLVDCVSFAVMRDLRMTHALTLDSHFADEGFVVIP